MMSRSAICGFVRPSAGRSSSITPSSSRELDEVREVGRRPGEELAPGLADADGDRSRSVAASADIVSVRRKLECVEHRGDRTKLPQLIERVSGALVGPAMLAFECVDSCAQEVAAGGVELVPHIGGVGGQSFGDLASAVGVALSE